MEQDRFVGTWRLVSFELRRGDGQVSHPFGQDAAGYIMYARDGHMSVAFMSADRPPFACGDPQAGRAEEKVSAMDTFFAYCGRYEISGDKVVHHIEVSLFPNWSGADQERIYEFRGDRLTLSTPPFQVGGVEQTAHLVWEHI